MNRLRASAQKEETKWIKVLQIFEDRFDVPFRISIKNQAAVILESEKPVKSFSFIKDNEKADDVEKSDLLGVLSQVKPRGEACALHSRPIV